MRRWMTAIWPALLGAAWLLCLFGPVLLPARVLANRDIVAFHLPLKTAFHDLARLGPPLWNPWLHGGQPILSNPSYAAFYPPSWLFFLVPPAYALSLMAVLHAAIAFAGAWRLARHFGGGPGTAALAGVGYVGCGAYFSLLSAYNLFGSMAWLPWILAWADESLRLPRESRWWRPALLAGGALGLQLLSGEPSPVIMSSLALLALAAAAGFRRPAAAPRVLVAFLFAAALAAVQLLPTLNRLADSPRKALPSEIATIWSMPPHRLVEIAFPRFFGDPTRVVEGLYFGFGITDRGPYVGSLYPGLLLAVLGASALLAGRIPRRAAWALCFAAGCLLALGRHNPIYAALRRTIPVLAVLRFPEKFVILAILVLAMAGVLRWQRLLDDRDAGRPESANLPLALSLAALAIALTLTVLLFTAPRVAAWFVISHALPVLPAASRGLALEYLRHESWGMARTAAAVALFLGLCRWRRPPRRLLEVVAVVLLAADLWQYGHGLLQTVPAAAYRRPPPLAAALLPARDRIFWQEVPAGGSQVLRRWGDPQTLFTRSSLLELKPYSGLIWHIPYMFEVDFDMMLTGWGRKADDLLLRESADLQMLYRYLGVWNVGTLLLQKPFQEQLAELRDPAAAPLREVANTYVLPRFRFVPRVTFHASHAAAYAAAHAQAWTVARDEHCVRPGQPQDTLAFRRPPRLLGIADRGGRIQMRYRADEGGFFVAAMTYDRGWRALVDERPLPTYPTAACQLGVALPPGEHRFVLSYRDPLVSIGALISLLALLGALLALGRGRRMA
jgi:hypothetical protein